MEKTINSKLFWTFTVLVAAGIFAVGINRNKVYQAEMKILILPKSEIAARSIEQIVENAKEIPNSLSFYDKLVEFNPTIDQGISGLSDSEKRKAWKSKIETRRIGKSGMISISAFNADQVQAEDFVRQVTNDLQAVMGKYYNLDTSLDVRIVDGPIVFLVSKTNLVNWTLISLLGGLIASLAVFSSMNLSSKRDSSDKEPSKAQISLKELSKYDFRKSPKTQSQERQASAPANLPIAQDVFPEESMQEEAKHLHREATPDEVKERLNKLLKGN
jgi:capsular polysaccharide biosynthesis protein